MSNDSNKIIKIKAKKPDVSIAAGDYNAFNLNRKDEFSIGSSFSDYEDNQGSSSGSSDESGTTNQNNPVKVKALKFKPQSTAVQHVSKHFDVVVGIDIHWTQIPPPPSFRLIPLPLPHPFIGLIFDPVDYIHVEISIPKWGQDFIGLFTENPPKSIPLGGTVYVYGRHIATTTTSVMGLGIPKPPKKLATGVPVKSPIVHITGSLPVYKIPLKELEAPHDGEVYKGSKTVIVKGSELSGSKAQQVLTCWGLPFGHQYFPPAWLALYNHIGTMYIQFNTGKPVLVGGPFVPHKYTISDILMRVAAILLMKGISWAVGKAIAKFNKLLQKIFPDNGFSKWLCSKGFEPVNFVTGAMDFEWEDFKIYGVQNLSWENIWRSDNKYPGMFGNGVSNNYELFLIPQEQDGVAAFHHPEENQTVPIPYIEPGNEFEYYRLWKIWQKRPDENSWVIKLNENVYTYKAFYNTEFEKVFRIEKIEYINGEILQFQYDPRGKVLTKIEDQAGRHLLFFHNNAGDRVTEIGYRYKEVNDLLVKYEYDERGNLIKVFDAAGKSIDFHYDENNCIIRRKNRNGMEYIWEYDEEGRVVYTSGKDGFQEGRIKYFPQEGYNEVYYTQKNGKVERYYYDENNLVYKIDDAMGGETWYDYTPFNERKLIATPEGKVSGYEFDERGNIKNHQTPDGEEFSYIYDENNRLIHRKEPSGLTESWEYDEAGRLKHWKRLDESKIEYFYNERQKQPISSKDSNGLETYWEYNDFGQIISVSNNRNVKQEFRYDNYGRLVSQNGENEAPTVWKRDVMGRVREFSSGGQKPLKIQYDAYDLPVCVSNGSEEWFMEYTPMGSLKKQSRRSAKTLQALSTLIYDYNAYEQLYRITNEKREEYTFTRNLNDEVILERDFDGQKKEFVRNKDGQVIKTLLPGNKEIFHEYDAGGRLTYNRYTSGFWESFEYDKTGLLVKAENLMSETEFIRNPFGQITQEKQGEHILNYIYDEMGRLTSLKSSLGAEVDYEYTNEGYLKCLTAQTEETRQNMLTPFWKSEIQVDVQGRQVKRKMNGGVESLMEHDALGRCQMQKVSVDGKESLHKVYHWKENFKLAKTLNVLTGGKVSYDYDAFGSLMSAKYDEETIEYKNPDETGNLYKTKDRKDCLYDKGGKLRRDKNWYYHYDEWGNLRLKTRSSVGSYVEESKKTEFTSRFLLPDGEIYGNRYDQKAEIRKYSKRELREYDKIREQRGTEFKQKKEQKAEWQQGDWEYLWYSNGMLRRVIKPDGSTVNFEYDALGRRIAKISKDKERGNKIYRYIWDGNVLLHEWSYALEERLQLVTDAEGWVKYDREELVENITTWVYERGSFTPCAKIVGKEKYSIISDYIGRPVQVYDRFGKLVWEAEYDIYGGLRNIKGAKDFIPFRQAGQYEDSETGLYYNRFRYYNPETGSYISKDPIGLAGNNPNLYAYVRDSNTWGDPFGLDVYDLIADADGWYPVYEKGSLNPTSYQRLNKGDVYKIGESINPSKRYSQTRLDEARINRSTATSVAIDANGKPILDANGNPTTASLRRKVDPTTIGNTKQADRLIETQKIQNYEQQHGQLPPGNKTYH